MCRPGAWDVSPPGIRLARKHIGVPFVRKAAMNLHDVLLPHDGRRERARRALLLDQPVHHVLQATQVAGGTRRQHDCRDEMRLSVLQEKIDPRQSWLQFGRL